MKYPLLTLAAPFVLLNCVLSDNYTNGQCDSEFCACTVPLLEGWMGDRRQECPPWMKNLATGYTYSGTSCSYNESEILCILRPDDEDITVYCAPNEPVTLRTVVEYNGTVVYEVNEDNPAPECPEESPYGTSTDEGYTAMGLRGTAVFLSSVATIFFLCNMQ